MYQPSSPPRPPAAPRTYYDPTSEYRESRRNSNTQSPGARPNSFTPNYQSARPPEHLSPPTAHASYSSPAAATTSPRARPAAAADYYHQAHPPSPVAQAAHYKSAMRPPPPTPSPAERPPSSTRVADPMSFSSILSSDNDPPKPLAASPQASKQQPTPSSLQPPIEQERLERQHVDPTRHPAEIVPKDPETNGVARASVVEPSAKASPTPSTAHVKASSVDRIKVNGDSEPLAPSTSRANRAKIIIDEKEYQKALLAIDEMSHSDLEGPGFEEEKRQYAERSAKRSREVESREAAKRKRRRIAQITKLADTFGRQAIASKERYLQIHEPTAWQQIQAQDVAEEKERKKVMQRNRRRETTKQKAEQQAAELKQRAQETEDITEKEKLVREAEKAEKKATATTKLLNGEIPNRDLRESSPLAATQPGGVMGSFQLDDSTQEPPKKRRGVGSNRPKKSKEQKQAEKDMAAAAHAAMERGDEPVVIAPKTDTPREGRKISLYSKGAADREAQANKAYDQLYEQIWRDIARKDIPKVYRLKENSLTTKQSNLRKTAQLASKEARRWQLKTNKSTKDTQARAKRVMKEMLSFWRRNEREERDQRKLAEKQELENARKAEADREANRQKRKLNFLISQTELYSHFIGKKVKTDEAERGADDVAVSNQTVTAGDPKAPTVGLPDAPATAGAKVTNFEDLDFDAEDDAALQAAAMANAQNAIEEAQNRARTFNDGQIQDQLDEGEMNFQNPTSLQSMDISQPDMLTCQLKEYQLKGLNWLVNLYEQGINGILADEMGLGKTIQSISVMAYLAEKHNIWGPFLVIAPASTLHNWQQEITRFVPGLKVLPYWGSAKDRKVLRKMWDRKHITYTKPSAFHVLVTSYQLVVVDAPYFQKMRWQYMVLDEAQAIKSSQSSRWKSLLGFHCRNRLLLTGTPIQNNMQELWALLHFIMPSLFDSHDEFSDWFSKDIESHAQSNTKLNEDQLKRLHMILKPFMLRRIKKHVQKELGDKIEEDVFCDLTYRQRAYYTNLRKKISIMDLIEKAAIGDDQDTATLMNLVMQFRKVCNHPDLFERAETMSPVSFAYFAETASFMREGHQIEVGYSVRSMIDYQLPRLIARDSGRLDIAGPDNPQAGWKQRYLYHLMNIWTPEHIVQSSKENGAFSWLRFVDRSPGEVASDAHTGMFDRAVDLRSEQQFNAPAGVFDEDEGYESGAPAERLFKIVDNKRMRIATENLGGGTLDELFNISRSAFYDEGYNAIEPCSRLAACAPPVELYCPSQGVIAERRRTFFNVPMRKALFGISEKTEKAILDSHLDLSLYPAANMLPAPISDKGRYTKIQVPSMRRFVTDSGKLARLDRLLGELKEGGHRVLLYFQMTRMIDLMEEYLTYRNYKYCRLDGSTKLEDRRDTVADFQTRSDLFVFLLSTRAGGLGINLTAADTVIFYDSDWNPTIDSQAMDRAHRLGQTKQVTVYRMITRGTIEERIRRRALQKEEVQRVVIQGGSGAGGQSGVDFNTRSRENRTKDIAMWLADDDQAAEIEKKEAEIAEKEAREGLSSRGRKKAASKKKTELSLDDMYHEGEGNFDDSGKPSGAATPITGAEAGGPPGRSGGKRKGVSKKAKSIKEKLAIVDGGM